MIKNSDLKLNRIHISPFPPASTLSNKARQKFLQALGRKDRVTCTDRLLDIYRSQDLFGEQV